jgi:diacylglycerol kinase family enzyme
MSRLVRIGSVVLFAAALAGPAAAQSSPPPSRTPGKSAAGDTPAPESALHGPAKDAYESAKLLVANHDFAGALAQFARAYDLSKAPEMLFDMAICQKNLLHYARMQALLTRYLVEGGASLSPSDHQSVDSALLAIRSLVASLKVTVNVDGATVLVDGEVMGTTPLASPLAVDLGRRTVMVQKPDFDAITKVVDVVGGSVMDIPVTLVEHQNTGQLVITSDDDATVSIDGKIVGKGRFDAALAAGAHEVHLTEPGRMPYSSEVDLKGGETRTLQVTLEIPHHAPIWPWVVGGALVAAGAAVGGYFLFRPADRIGASPTGSISTVHLSSF